MSSGLQLRGLSAGYPRAEDVVFDVELHAPRGSITALLGPNGSGKSTLLKAVLGLVASRGEVFLDEDSLAELLAMQRAKRLAYVPQKSLLTARLTVRQVVEQGRFAHRGPYGGATTADTEAVEKAMNDVGVYPLAQRFFTEISGGEQQRVLLARALATGANTLLLDEPTSALDVRQVLGLHQVLRRLAERGCSILVVLHGLDEALAHADRAVLLKEGRVVAEGDVKEVISGELIRSVYGVEIRHGEGLGFHLLEDGQ